MTPIEKFRNESLSEIESYTKDQKFKDITSEWLHHAHANKYSYHFNWLSRPIIQYPQDIVQTQELIWQVKPDLIIETGIAHGGSLILSASMLAMLDYCEAIQTGQVLDPQNSKRKVLGIDIDIREHNKKEILEHPLSTHIEMLQGSSVDPKIVDQVKQTAANFKKVMVFLDSNHTHQHVLDELNAYAPLVTSGSYCIVFDTLIEDLNNFEWPNRDWKQGDNPKTAVWEFLKENPDFESDKLIDAKLQISVASEGFLKRR